MPPHLGELNPVQCTSLPQGSPTGLATGPQGPRFSSPLPASIYISPPHGCWRRQSWRGCKVKCPQSSHPQFHFRDPWGHRFLSSRQHIGKVRRGRREWNRRRKERRQRPRQWWSHGKSAPPCWKGTGCAAVPAERGSRYRPTACAHTAAWLSPECCTSRLCSWCKVSDTPSLTQSPLHEQPGLENLISSTPRARQLCCCVLVDNAVLSPNFQSTLVLNSSWLLNPVAMRPVHLLAAGGTLEMAKRWAIKRFSLKFQSLLTFHGLDICVYLCSCIV